VPRSCDIDGPKFRPIGKIICASLIAQAPAHGAVTDVVSETLQSPFRATSAGRFLSSSAARPDSIERLVVHGSRLT
jgi:hypothetical protein